MALPPQTGVTDLSVGLILAQGVDGPKSSGNPADQRKLKDNANDPGERPPDREEEQGGQKNRDQQTHEQPFLADIFVLRQVDELISA